MSTAIETTQRGRIPKLLSGLQGDPVGVTFDAFAADERERIECQLRCDDGAALGRP